MQKTPFSTILREELLRALAFGLSFFIVMTAGFVGIAHAANGGLFGDLLSRILASEDWNNPGDFTVKNALKLNNMDASQFVKNPSGGMSCPIGQCITKIAADGTPECH